ncbi:MAG: phosphatidate cytidylyltransferase [Jatrophihabitans sp.]
MPSDDPSTPEQHSAPVPPATTTSSSAANRARKVAGLSRAQDEALQQNETPAPPRPRATRREPGRPARVQPGVSWVRADAVSTSTSTSTSTSASTDDRPLGDAAAPTDPPTPKAGRNLPVAIAVGLGLGGLVFASLFVYRPSFAYLVGAAVLYGCYELGTALRSASIRLTLSPLLVGAVAMLSAAWLRGPSGLVVAALITLLGVLIWRVADGAQDYTRDAAASAFVLLYLPMLAGFAVLLAHPDDGGGRVVAFVATVVCSDVGGYAAGVLFGKHPLAPVVSKAKTWEGFAGSVLACSTAGVLFLTLMFHEAWWKGLLFGLAIVVTATLGDLGESMIKRDVGVKDMGSLLPGHGGLMDRLDSLLPCAAVAYLLLSGFAPV